MEYILEAENASKILGKEVPVNILKNINLSVSKGEFVTITGPSGSGKSTLLYLLGGLDRPTSGLIKIDGKDTQKISDNDLAKIRINYIGFIFQFHFLLPEFTALENVLISGLLANISLKEAKEKAKKILIRLGLENRLTHRPSQLSGGEQQRVAIARAIVNSPLILLADEPTGNLDSQNSLSIFQLFEELNKDYEQTIIMVTHNIELAKRSDRRIEIVDGGIVS